MDKVPLWSCAVLHHPKKKKGLSKSLLTHAYRPQVLAMDTKVARELAPAHLDHAPGAPEEHCLNSQHMREDFYGGKSMFPGENF